MRFLIGLALVSGIAVVSARAGEFDEKAKWCADSRAVPDFRIEACTWLLNSSELKEGQAAIAYRLRGDAQAGKGAPDRAIGDYDRAIALDPKNAQARTSRGLAYSKRGDRAAATLDFDAVFSLKSGDAAFFNSTAWYLATQSNGNNRDGATAIRFATEAVRLDGDAPYHYDTLAAAYAEAGQFADAVATEQKAIARLRAAGRDSAVAGFQARLDLYRAGKPYRAK